MICYYISVGLGVRARRFGGMLIGQFVTLGRSVVERKIDGSKI